MYRIVKALFLSLLGVCSSFALQQPSTPQQKPEPSEPPVVIRTNTRLVIVDVVAKNSKGEPVTDLKNEDFTVLEDGKPQQVKVFNFQSRATDSIKPLPLTTSPDIVTNIPTYQANGALNIILLDGLNTSLPRQAYMRERMIALLEKLPDDVPIAIYTLGSRLSLIQDFTDDHETLKKVVKNLHNNTSPTQQNPSGTPAQGLPGVFVHALGESLQPTMLAFQRESNVAFTQNRVDITLAALSSIARSLAAFPGRKNLIWISDEFPLIVNTKLTLRPVTSYDPRDVEYVVSEAANKLMDSQVVIYPVDARGIAVPALFDVGVGQPDDAVGGRPANGNYSEANLALMSSELNARVTTHEVMNTLADSTGGKALYNNNNVDALVRQGIDDGSTYYTLGYYPADKNWDGKFRKIQVKTNHSGVNLHYRQGYYAINPAPYGKETAQQHEMALNQALSLTSPISTGLPFRAKVLKPADGKITVNFAIDPRMVTFDKKDSGMQSASVDCMVQVYKDENTSLKREFTVVHAELTPENFERISKTFFPCQQSVDLPAGKYTLRLGVIDNRTGLIGTATTTTTVQ